MHCISFTKPFALSFLSLMSVYIPWRCSPSISSLRSISLGRRFVHISHCPISEIVVQLPQDVCSYRPELSVYIPWRYPIPVSKILSLKKKKLFVGERETANRCSHRRTPVKIITVSKTIFKKIKEREREEKMFVTPRFRRFFHGKSGKKELGAYRNVEKSGNFRLQERKSNFLTTVQSSIVSNSKVRVTHKIRKRADITS